MVETPIKKYDLRESSQQDDTLEYWKGKSNAYKLEIVDSLREDAIKMGLYPDFDEKKQDFKEFIKLLHVHKVQYLFVGEYAFAIHAEPRFTKDLDIFIRRDLENASKLLLVLQQFGFAALDLREEDLMVDDQVIQLGYPPLCIDILTEISGVTFDDAWKNRVEGNYDGQLTYFFGKDELQKIKLATGRKSDILDAEKLRWLQGFYNDIMNTSFYLLKRQILCYKVHPPQNINKEKTPRCVFVHVHHPHTFVLSKGLIRSRWGKCQDCGRVWSKVSCLRSKVV